MKQIATFSGKGLTNVRPHPGFLPPGEGESLAVSIETLRLDGSRSLVNFSQCSMYISAPGGEIFPNKSSRFEPPNFQACLRFHSRAEHSSAFPGLRAAGRSKAGECSAEEFGIPVHGEGKGEGGRQTKSLFEKSAGGVRPSSGAATWYCDRCWKNRTRLIIERCCARGRAHSVRVNFREQASFPSDSRSRISCISRFQTVQCPATNPLSQVVARCVLIN